ncbi:MAG: hypothetical protein ABIE74_06275 [Pseudomonadota bacterium]
MSLKAYLNKKVAACGIAALCFGYFASYVPYSMMTKMVTKGLFTGMDGTGYSGFAIQPIAVLGSFVAMYLFITLKGWWKFATQWKVGGISLPRPRWFTFLSGLCTAGIIVTTTLSYSFSGISIVFAMLLMRGGVLIIAPVVDLFSRRKRKIYWPSLVASFLSVGALLVAFSGNAGTAMTTVAAIDIACYLGCYFLRLTFMSNKAKSNDIAEKRRFFTEEQMVANPVLLVALLIVGLIGSTMSPDSMPGLIWTGFSKVPFEGFFFTVLLIGIFSYGTGLFGSLIFLDKREHTFCAPANRCSSIVSGVIATYLLAIFYGQKYPSTLQIIGVALIIGAILFLMYRAVMERRRKGAASCITCTPDTPEITEESEEETTEGGKLLCDPLKA